MHNDARVIGVLGGMGPEASVELQKILVELTPAARDQEHHVVITLSDPTIPDRTEFLLEQAPSPLPKLLERARDLERFGASFLAIPCNTAHYFWAEIQEAVSIPVLNIIEETVSAVRAHPSIQGKRTPVGILATKGTLASQLYQLALQKRDLVPIEPNIEMQAKVTRVIAWTKSRSNSAQRVLLLKETIENMVQLGAAGIILGCTELGLNLSGEQTPVPIFDSLQILARAAIREACRTPEESV